MSENRLNEIEATLAHQDQQMQDLNDVVTRQAREIDALKARLQKTQVKLSMLESGVEDGDTGDMGSIERAALEKPPHY